jgi:hypothetical protein
LGTTINVEATFLEPVKNFEVFFATDVEFEER